MILGRVAGRVVQTIQHPATMNRRLLIVDRLDELGRLESTYEEILPMADWSHGRDGGPRKIVRDDLK